MAVVATTELQAAFEMANSHTHTKPLSFPILWLLWLYSRVPLSFLIVVVVVVGELCITVEVAAAAAGLGLFDVGLVF